MPGKSHSVKLDSNTSFDRLHEAGRPTYIEPLPESDP